MVGLPEERIMIKGGRVFINGILLPESYIDTGVLTGGGPFLSDNKEYMIPEDQYFVMGDNRPNSSDSRYWGPITKKVMTGRAWVSYWPISSLGVVQIPGYDF